ncbi:amidohydrolase [Acidaminobacter sp. JC074]|uniref:amidohydrolase family protein n=1 Tax=Acidaminobacter sp. JC074 TaxID=2530199 RepID=UPI001F0EB254|nr:amidohydrolase family protein [Acidaminobacter sp. JC074]MCH4889756.1 amidohydrolase [Acidaminobacter sp. JC074]
MKAIVNVKIYDYQNYIPNGYVIFDRQIISVGPMEDFEGHYEIYDGKGMLLLPGLINGHTHIYSTLFRGSPLSASPNNFLEILEQIWWKFDKELTLDSIKESAKAYAQESLLCGVTSIIDHHASGVIEDSLMVIHHELEKREMKHLLCFETSDRFDIEACIKENLKYIESNHFGLHASMSLSNESLAKVSAVLGDRPIHIHVAESDLDEELSLSQYDKRVVQRLDDFNLLNKDSILAHCIYIDDQEGQMIKNKNCVVAINPTSNLNNGVGLYNQSLLSRLDIPLLIGTDGLGVNVAKEYQHLFYVGNQSNESNKDVSLDWVKKQVIHSYDYFNKLRNTRIGRISKGYDSDFILVDYHSITPVHTDNIFAHVLFGAFEALRPHTVIVGGKRKVDNYDLIENEVINEDVVKNLWRRL